MLLLWVGLQCVIVVFPDHTHLLFVAKLQNFRSKTQPIQTISSCNIRSHYCVNSCRDIDVLSEFSCSV